MARKLIRNLLYITLLYVMVGCGSANFSAKPWQPHPLTLQEITDYQLTKGLLLQGRIRFQGEEGFSGSFWLEAEGEVLRIRIEHSLGPTLAEIYLSPTEKYQWIPSKDILYQYSEDTEWLPEVSLPLDVKLLRYLLLGGKRITSAVEFKGVDLEKLERTVRYKGKLNSSGIDWPQKIWMTTSEAGEKDKKLFFYIQSMQWGHFNKIQLTEKAKQSSLIRLRIP